MKRFALVGACLLLCWPTCLLAEFNAGDLYFAVGTDNTPTGHYNATDGGDVSGTYVVLPDRCPGQLAWSEDLSTMYVSQFDANQVVAVDSSGAAAVFATGLPWVTGLARLEDGSLLAVSYSTGQIYDITAGGDFSGEVPLVTGLDEPRNLVQLSDGRVLVADQGRGMVYDINYPVGGDLSADPGFATGLDRVIDLVQDGAGQLYIASYSDSIVMDITAGGDFSAAVPFATGRNFIGLAVHAGMLVAIAFAEGEIYDITAGGDYSAATPWAWGMVGADSALDTVPDSSLLIDGFESGDTSAWSVTVP